MVTIAALVALIGLAWVYLLSGARMGSMAGMEAMAPSPGWPVIAAMWVAMMVAMMLPSAAPTILLYARIHRHSVSKDSSPPTATFLGGYLASWIAVSLVAAALQVALGRMEIGSPAAAAGLLIAAGLYQLSPLKDACLGRCRSPTQFLTSHYRPGPSGALRLGLLHGAYCVGCCWLLMALLFVGGVMNLLWVAALTLLVAAEKLLPGGRWIARIAGVALIGWGLAFFLD